MRASASTPPNRPGKRHLLESCAIAAGLAALAFGGPALAQVQGSGQVVSGAATIQSTGAPGVPPSTTRVTTTTAQTIINWTPADAAPAGGPIDFLPVANTLEFFGTGQYIVLNRFVARDALGNPIPIARQIALNGTVNSFVTTPGLPAVQGGSIWFYNAGGILIGRGAAINVGSLILTANDIDTTGGLLGPGGTIRFRGASGSSSTVEVGAGSFIGASNGNPGSSYVALVAPRIVQSGIVNTDGSTAYVAAEQADIRINNGLFDINVLIGAEGGTVITHTGVTGGPAHQQGDTDQSRVYMVAIPKNDAVTMLVAGQVGYQDAVVAQVDPDGAVVLAAGYNVTAGAINAAPVNATAADITVNDIIFQSSVTAHASGAFLGQPLAVIPPLGGPVVALPPPHLGRLLVRGDGVFIGDASATLNVNAGRAAGATGSLTVQSLGTAAAPGTTTVNVNGGILGAGDSLIISALGLVDAASGDNRGGTATLTVTNGGGVGAVNAVNVVAPGVGDIGADGSGGNGTGGAASITVSGAGSALTGGTILAAANGRGGGLLGGGLAADFGGNGTGGTATVSVQNGGRITAAGALGASASGLGEVGNDQSGLGSGGTARIEATGARTTIQAQQTSVSAAGIGGGSISNPNVGIILSLAAGDGQGGSATIAIDADATSVAALGATSLDASGTGGGGGGGENTVGGDGDGGDATVSVDGGVVVAVDSLTVTVAGLSGGAATPSATTGRSGDATGGTIAVTADGGSVLASGGTITLDASADSVAGENRGDAVGGDVIVSAVGTGGNSGITAQGEFQVDADAGQFSTGIPLGTGSTTGGNIDFIADGGTIAAGFYSVTAAARTDNTTGAGGTAQGGTIDILPSNAGAFNATDTATFSSFSVDAGAGVSQGGTAATGGRITLVVDGGTASFASPASFSASGVAGGDTGGAGNFVLARGGSILIQLTANALNASTLNFADIFASADGSSAAPFEGAANLNGTAAGNGGDVTVDVQGGALTGGALQISANGAGGAITGGNSEGRGGTATYGQTGGDVNVTDIVISANGFGGNGSGGQAAGTGFGGTAIIDLNGGTLDAANIVAQAVGVGGFGQNGDDLDPANPIAGGVGGFGQGGTATINLDGTAVVNTTTLNAFASGVGGFGGNFFAFNAVAGDGGDGGDALGGTATVNLTAGTLTTTDIAVDSGGFGGDGGGLIDAGGGPPVGAAQGGTGGTGRGGTATINAATAIVANGFVGVFALGFGGIGGDSQTGGDGGGGIGGTAEVVVDNLALGTLDGAINAEALGGTGGTAFAGLGGSGGSGGDASGGTARLTLQGANAAATTDPVLLVANGTGGNAGGGDGVGITGNGGNGSGGTVELLALGGTLTLMPISPGPVTLRSSGAGGNGTDQGNGAGGTVNLIARGGTITSGGNDVDFLADGAGLQTRGGTIRLTSENAPGGAGNITLGATTMNASGDIAGRIELLTDTGIRLTSLDAQAFGTAAPTNNDPDVAPAGIFLAATGGLIQTDGAMTLATGSSVGVFAQAGGMVNVGGDLDLQAADQVTIRHDFRTGAAPTVQTGGSLNIQAGTSISGAPGSLLDAGTSLSLNATLGAIGVDSLSAASSTSIVAQGGAVVVTGTSTSGTDLTVDTAGTVDIANAAAGDDIDIGGTTLTLGTLTSTGAGLDSELDGSNIVLDSTGAATVDHAESDGDFTANVGSLATGLNSIIAVGDISVTSPGAVDLGNSSAGGFVQVGGQSIVFNSVTAGTTVALNATGTAIGAEGINGIDITAGGDIALSGDIVAITGAIQGGASLSIFADDGAVGIADAVTAGNIAIDASGNVAGVFAAGGNVSLTAGGDIAAQATAIGGYVDPNGVTSEGTVFVDADGDAAIDNSSAATMFGVRAGGAAAVSNSIAGEDMLVISGTTTALNTVGAGDDLTVDSKGALAAAGVSTSGLGPDSRTLTYGFSAAAGADIFQIAASPANLSNITLAAPTAAIDASDVVAFDNLTMTAGGILTTTGAIQAGLAAGITGGALDLESVTAGTDIALTATAGGITAIGALSAGHDLTVTAPGDGQFADLTAGDDIRIDLGGALTAASLTATGLGLDNDFDGGSIEIDTVGNLTVTGAADANGRIDWVSGGNIVSGPITAVGFAFLDAVGTVDLTGAIAAQQGMLVEGGSLAFGDATSTNGQIILRAVNGALTSTGNVTAAGSITANATGALSLTGNVDALDFVEITGGDVTVGDVTSQTRFVVLKSTAGAIAAPGTVTAGTDIVIDAATGGQFNGLVAGDDIGIVAGGPVSIGSLSASGDNAQGEEVGSNVTGTIDGALIVTGDTFAADAISLTATSIALQGAEAGGSIALTATGGTITSPAAITAGGNISAFATGDLGGSYTAGGDISLGSDANVDAAANANGGFPDPNNGDAPTAGNVFVDADGNVVLTNSSAAGMFGVNAGGSASLTNASAGEDMLVLAGTTATLGAITVGDDLDLVAGGNAAVTGATATAAGPDGFMLNYFPGNGFTISQGEGGGLGAIDGADIELTSTGGAIAASALSAGDDIAISAATTLSVSGATTHGLGQTGGGSIVKTQSGDATLAGLDAFDDIEIGSTGAVRITAPAVAGRDIVIAAASLDIASLMTPGGALIDGLDAGRDLQAAIGGAITGGSARAGGNLQLFAGTTVDIARATTGPGGSLTLSGADGIAAAIVGSGGVTSLASSGGAIQIGALTSAGPVDANGDSIAITGGGGALVFGQLNADVGDASVTNGGDLSVTAGAVAGRATLRSTGGDLGVTQLGAANIDLVANDAMTLGAVTAADALTGEARGVLTVNGAVTGRSISFGSRDIVIDAAGRIGTAGATESLDIRNNDDLRQTFVGGTGARGGFHVDAAEMTRLFGTDIRIFAPEVDNDGEFVAAAPGALPVPIASINSNAAPDVVIDDFTLTGGTPNSNLGANGSLTIETPGKARVIGDVLFTGLGDANGFIIDARNALEVILGEGTIRLTGAAPATPAGQLTLLSEDVIVATADAIADVAAAATIEAIDERLAQNDGIVINDGALFAGGIDVSVIGSFYVQNSGAGTRFAERRGLTFGPLGLNVDTEGSATRIVINGVHLGPSGQVVGLDAIPLLTINGATVGGIGANFDFDQGSTMNGCMIVSATSCAFQEFEASFPVQDVIDDEDEEGEGDDAEGLSLPTALITMRELDPLTGEPLLDDPVTGAGNDDLWTPPSE